MKNVTLIASTITTAIIEKLLKYNFHTQQAALRHSTFQTSLSQALWGVYISDSIARIKRFATLFLLNKQ